MGEVEMAETMRVIETIRRLIVSAATSLRASFATYWPTFGDTGAHERNISLHIAHACLAEGYAVFGESHADGSANERFDLVAIAPQRTHVIVGEFKQLW